MDSENGGGGSGGTSKEHALKVDGGMTANNLLMQFQSDITGRRVVRPVVAETTALGAAYAAGLASGFWTSQEELSEHWRPSKTWSPLMQAQARAASVHNWERGVARSLFWTGGDGAAASAKIGGGGGGPAVDPFVSFLRFAGKGGAAGGATPASPRRLFTESTLYLATLTAFLAGGAAFALSNAIAQKRAQDNKDL